MKRLLPMVMVIVWIFTLFGCDSNVIRTPAHFYYCTDPVAYNDPNGVVSPEIRERDGFGDDLTSLLNLYMQGPVSEGFLSPFPSKVSVQTLLRADDVCEIQLSKEFSVLTGHNLTIACVCITMTVIELTGCETVRIRVADVQLDGSDYIEMSRQDLVFIDEYTTQTEP